MTYIIKKFDEMTKSVETDAKGRKSLAEFRQSLVMVEKHSELLANHFDYSLNSGEMNDEYAKKLGLL